jgi:hypothetical protein
MFVEHCFILKTLFWETKMKSNRDNSELHNWFTSRCDRSTLCATKIELCRYKILGSVEWKTNYRIKRYDYN